MHDSKSDEHPKVFARHTFSTLGVRLAASIVLRQDLSTVAKRLPSSGSCCMMSSLLKMGASDIHVR